MTEPLSLDVISSEFLDEAEAWVLQDESSGKYVVIPHQRSPGRQIIHYFLSRSDAEKILVDILDLNEKLRKKEIFPVSVNLKLALKLIAVDKTPGHADGFVVHSPNEVYEFKRDQDR